MKISAKKKQPVVAPEYFPAAHQARLISLLLALITIVIYLPAGFHDFIFFDDPTYVSDNPMVQNGLSWAGLKWDFIGWHATNWHPLTWLSLQLDCQLFGANAGAIHIVNVLFHAANTVLLFQLWLRLTGACWPSALVAALFAWHPLHVESVAWAAERKDVLSAFFGFLALLAYARFATSGCVRRKDWGLALLFFALGLLAKSMLVTLPFVLLLLDYWPLRRFTADRRILAEGWLLAREKWPFFGLSALFCLMTYCAQLGGSVVAVGQYRLGLRCENAVVACTRYLGKAVWPANLSVFYPLPKHFPPGHVLLSLSILGSISFLAWYGRRHRYFLTGWLWFLGMLVPVIGLVQEGDQSMADRYTYLPAVGLFAAAAFGLADAQTRWLIRPRLLALMIGFILSACVAVTEHQLAFWQNSKTLFLHALAVTRHNHPAQGSAAGADGQSDPSDDDGDDLLIVQAAPGEKRPFAAQVQLMFGQSAEQDGKPAEAIQCYRAALRLDPDIVEAHNNLGNLLDQADDAAGALTEYQAAARLRPETPLVHENLGTQFAELGRFDEALREYQDAMRLAPADPQPSYLAGKLWLRRGQTANAVTAFKNALQLDPSHLQTLTYLARVLASDENPQIRNGPAAVILAEQAVNLTGGTQPFVLGALAMAYAETGRFAEARKTARMALHLASGASPQTLSNLQAQLTCYLADQPFRDSFTNAPAPTR